MTKKSVKNVDIGADENGVLDLKSKENMKNGFKVKKIDDELEIDNSTERRNRNIDKDSSSQEDDDRTQAFADKLEKAVVKVVPKDNSSFNSQDQEPKEMIKVKFDKFVQLVATRDFWQVMERNKNENIILSSNLLTELAGAVDEKGEKKTPVIFLVGLAIGVIVTY
ncbi:hypothetical protein GF376_04965, partial [Candidatus Peregrinibacteria bacterium]|nr:hypothetical protein [Candidatus Peregrinibacteria bacterium]